MNFQDFFRIFQDFLRILDIARFFGILMKIGIELEDDFVDFRDYLIRFKVNSFIFKDF